MATKINYRTSYIDPIHGFIYLTVDDLTFCYKNNFSAKLIKEINLSLQKIVASKSFMRLNEIKQLSATYKVFPGATHHRFLHSLGVFHLAKIALENDNLKWTKEEGLLFLYASLLHDIGHGPLSHSFEFLLGKKGHEWHEKNVVFCINNDPQIKKALLRISSLFSIDLIKALEVLFTNTQNLNFKNIDWKKVKSLLSSQFDVDRLDYLLRDSYFCGTQYIFGEGNLLLRKLIWNKREKKIYFINRYKEVLDHYLMTRYLMYSAVYLHKDSLASDLILYFLNQRLKNQSFTNIILKNKKYKLWINYDDHWIQREVYKLLESSDKITRKLANLWIYHNFVNCQVDIYNAKKVQKEPKMEIVNKYLILTQNISSVKWYNKHSPIYIMNDKNQLELMEISYKNKKKKNEKKTLKVVIPI